MQTTLRKMSVRSHVPNHKRGQRIQRRRKLQRRRFVIEQLEPRFALAADTLTIFAAGATNQETMELQIDGAVVQTWNNIGGNAETPAYQAYSYVSNTTLTPDRIRIAFTNDLYNPPEVDRNLRVDRIEINGVKYETEAPTVYSTGTWLPADAIQPGFRQSEFLHTNGYFQYAVNNGSMIQVIAAGWTGNENMELQINGQTVADWTNISGNPSTRTFSEYTYRAAGTVTADQVRVAFTNDVYNPPTTDYNLTIDKIIIDGVEYESEALSTLSTGTYVAAQGAIVPGYWETEVLHSNGYLQYLARSITPGNLGLETSVYATQENAGSVTLAVVRTGGSDGTVGINYRTNNGTAINGSDYTTRTGTLSFGPGETRKTVSIPILNNTIAEAPETFSFVIEQPTGGATLLAPRTATVTITDDDLILPNYTSFPAATGLKLNGTATIATSTLQLTRQVTNQIGSAFYTTPIPINIDTSFQTQFQFRTLGTTTGGDGLTFVIQNSTAGTSAISPGAGGSLGYSGILKSFAIEFDTIQNSGEINNNHLSVWRDGNMTNSLATKASTIDFNSGSPVFVWVDYNGDSDVMSIYLASTNTKPATPFHTLTVDLPSIIGSQAFFGFTASTGSAFNAHQIQNWQLNLNRPVGAPQPPVLDLVQETVVSGLTQPVAAQFSPDGRNMYIAEKSGLVRVVRDGVMQATPFIDIGLQVNNVRDRGLLDIAIHPNFAANPYIYLLFTYDPPEVYQHAANGLAGPDQPGNRAGRLIRVTANAATNFTTAIAGSEVLLLGSNSTWNNFNAFINSTFDLNAPQAGVGPTGEYIRDFIASDSESHTVGSLAFATDGSLYVSIGDGASYNSMDARATRVQDLDSLSGKVLRINPLNGQGYSNNPFYNGDLNSNRSKVYQSGLRNPFRISVNPNTSQLFIGEVGWTQWEELNSGPITKGGADQTFKPSAIARWPKRRLSTIAGP
jgi:glucose/arabinose dehydrogenase